MRQSSPHPRLFRGRKAARHASQQHPSCLLGSCAVDSDDRCEACERDDTLPCCRREEDSENTANQKPWWRKATDIQHAPEVCPHQLIASRNERVPHAQCTTALGTPTSHRVEHLSLAVTPLASLITLRESMTGCTGQDTEQERGTKARHANHTARGAPAACRGHAAKVYHSHAYSGYQDLRPPHHLHAWRQDKLGILQQLLPCAQAVERGWS